jgi:hypothetical protein
MDPNAARQKMIETANLVLALVGNRTMEDALTLSETMAISDAATTLAEAVHDLDEWLRSGGFLPDVWDYGTMRNLRRKQHVDIAVETPAPSKLVDDERPRVDGSKCPAVLVSIDGEFQGYRPCALDTGHDGPHA